MKYDKLVEVFRKICKTSVTPTATKFKVSNWELGLAKCEEFADVLDGVKSGFKLGIENTKNVRFKVREYPQTIEKRTAIVSRLIDDIKKGWIIPCDKKELEFVAPLFTTPKPDSVLLHRIVKDYSSGNEQSLNFNIKKEFKDVKYPQLKDIVTLADDNMFVCRIDLKSYYRQLAIHPTKYKYFGYYFEGCYMYDTRVPFGLASACKYAQKMGEAIIKICNDRFLPYYLRNKMCNYLDDFILFGIHFKECTIVKNALLKTFEWLGVCVNYPKTVEPTSVATILGFKYDLCNKTIDISTNRMNKNINLIDSLLHKKLTKVSYKSVESLVGKLQWTAIVLFPGKAFLKRLYNLLKSNDRGKRIYLSGESCKDLEWWKQYYTTLRGLQFDLVLYNFEYIKGELRTDASDWGIGAIWRTHWFSIPFGPEFLVQDIATKEIYAVLVALKTWSSAFSGRIIKIRVDSMHARAALIKKNDSKSLRMDMVRAVCMICLRLKIRYFIEYISSRDNKCADMLSRDEMTAFYQYTKNCLKMTVDKCSSATELCKIPTF